MTKLLDSNGRAIRSQEMRVPIFIVLLNRESGSAEIMDNQEMILRIPPAERRRIYDAILKMAPVSFKVPLDS